MIANVPESGLPFPLTETAPALAVRRDGHRRVAQRHPGLCGGPAGMDPDRPVADRAVETQRQAPAPRPDRRHKAHPDRPPVSGPDRKDAGRKDIVGTDLRQTRIDPLADPRFIDRLGARAIDQHAVDHPAADIQRIAGDNRAFGQGQAEIALQLLGLGIGEGGGDGRLDDATALLDRDVQLLERQIAPMRGVADAARMGRQYGIGGFAPRPPAPEGRAPAPRVHATVPSSSPPFDPRKASPSLPPGQANPARGRSWPLPFSLV